MENPYLFGEKIEEELIKITRPKQKPKSIFTVLQQTKLTFSLRPNNSPFCQVFYQEINNEELQVVEGKILFLKCSSGQRWELAKFSLLNRIWKFSVQKSHIQSAIKGLFPPHEFQKFPQAVRLQYFQNWEKFTSDPSILNLVKRYQIPFLSVPVQKYSPLLISMIPRKKV